MSRQYTLEIKRKRNAEERAVEARKRARARFRPRSPANVSGKTMNRVRAAHMRANARRGVDESREHEQTRFSLFVRIVTPGVRSPVASSCDANDIRKRSEN